MRQRQRAALAAALTAWSIALAPASAWAAAADYRFEVVGQSVPVGTQAPLVVRLVHVPTNRPVPNATIFQQRLEMAHDSTSMTGIVAPAQPDGQGNYRFSVQTSMEGVWTLSFVARVPGESEAIRARLTVRSMP